MNEQKLDWGKIEWIFEPENGSSDSMKIGISHMEPGAHQPRHVHGGDEQMMYIISGIGHQVIDNVEYLVEPGQTYHVPCGVSHEAFNDGREELVKLLVSIPAVDAPLKKETGANNVNTLTDTETGIFLQSGIENIYEQMLGSLHLPFAIKDANGRLVFRGGEYPEFCKKYCHVNEDINHCPLYAERVVYTAPYYEKPSAVVCEYGMSLYASPIVIDDGLIGYIMAGHIRTEAPRVPCNQEELPFNVPNSHIRGILKIIESINTAIQQQYRRYCLERDLRKGHDTEALLTETLSEIKQEALDLRINRHFLFNTLNMILGMAIREKAEQTYEAVASLSQMLQYAFKNESNFVNLREELTYLKNYTSLQQRRFGEQLTISYKVDESLLDELIPFNLLQPIVENVFRHAFEDTTKKKRLTINIFEEDNEIIINISDNGRGIDSETLIHLKEKIKNGDGNHGMPMIACKLEALYGPHYSFEIQSGKRGTKVSISLPRKEMPKYEESYIGRR